MYPSPDIIKVPSSVRVAVALPIAPTKPLPVKSQVFTTDTFDSPHLVHTPSLLYSCPNALPDVSPQEVHSFGSIQVASFHVW